MSDGHLQRTDEDDEGELGSAVTDTAVENHKENDSTDTESEHGDSESSDNTIETVTVTKRIIIRQRYTRRKRRKCIVCSQPIRNNLLSIQPCPCDYWVHHECLVSGLQSYEAKHPGCAPLGCRLCNTPYNISPEKNFMFRFLEKVSTKYGQFCKLGFFVLTVAVLDSTFTFIGLATLYKIYGNNEATEMIFSMSPIKAVAICKAIPVISIAINSIRWETELLRFLRRCSQLPVIGTVLPSADSHVRETRLRRTLFGVIVGGLMLPFAANVFGDKLFGTVQSRLFRFFLGGVTFLALKGVLRMYYRQRLYARQCFLSIEPYRGQ